jgi:hypothetical protein
LLIALLRSSATLLFDFVAALFVLIVPWLINALLSSILTLFLSLVAFGTASLLLPFNLLSLLSRALFDFLTALLLFGLTLLLLLRAICLSLFLSLTAGFFSIFSLLLSLISGTTLSISRVACSEQHCRADNDGKGYLFDVFLFHIFPFCFCNRNFQLISFKYRAIFVPKS